MSVRTVKQVRMKKALPFTGKHKHHKQENSDWAYTPIWPLIIRGQPTRLLPPFPMSLMLTPFCTDSMQPSWCGRG